MPNSRSNKSIDESIKDPELQRHYRIQSALEETSSSDPSKRPHIKNKVKKVREILPHINHDTALIALQESDYQVEDAISYILEGRMENWQSVGKRKNKTSAPSTQQRSRKKQNEGSKKMSGGKGTTTTRGTKKHTGTKSGGDVDGDGDAVSRGKSSRSRNTNFQNNKKHIHRGAPQKSFRRERVNGETKRTENKPQTVEPGKRGTPTPTSSSSSSSSSSETQKQKQKQKQTGPRRPLWSDIASKGVEKEEPKETEKVKETTETQKGANRSIKKEKLKNKKDKPHKTVENKDKSVPDEISSEKEQTKTHTDKTQNKTDSKTEKTINGRSDAAVEPKHETEVTRVINEHQPTMAEITRASSQPQEDLLLPSSIKVDNQLNLQFGEWGDNDEEVSETVNKMDKLDMNQKDETEETQKSNVRKVESEPLPEEEEEDENEEDEEEDEEEETDDQEPASGQQWPWQTYEEMGYHIPPEVYSAMMYQNQFMMPEQLASQSRHSHSGSRQQGQSGADERKSTFQQQQQQHPQHPHQSSQTQQQQQKFMQPSMSQHAPYLPQYPPPAMYSYSWPYGIPPYATYPQGTSFNNMYSSYPQSGGNPAMSSTSGAHFTEEMSQTQPSQQPPSQTPSQQPGQQQSGQQPGTKYYQYGAGMGHMQPGASMMHQGQPQPSQQGSRDSSGDKVEGNNTEYSAYGGNMHPQQQQHHHQQQHQQHQQHHPHSHPMVGMHHHHHAMYMPHQFSPQHMYNMPSGQQGNQSSTSQPQHGSHEKQW